MILTDLVRIEVCARDWTLTGPSLIPELTWVEQHNEELSPDKRASILDRLQKIQQDAHSTNFLTRFFRRTFYPNLQRNVDQVTGKISQLIETLQPQPPTDQTLASRITQVNPLTNWARFKRVWTDRTTEIDDCCRAIQEDHWATLEQRLKSGRMDLNDHGRNGMPYLMFAINSNRTAIAEALIAAGADVNQEDHRGDTPLAIACKKSNPSMVKLLLESGASVKSRSGYIALGLAASLGNAAIVRQLLEAGAPPNSRFSGHDPLTYAIENGPL